MLGFESANLPSCVVETTSGLVSLNDERRGRGRGRERGKGERKRNEQQYTPPGSHSSSSSRNPTQGSSSESHCASECRAHKSAKSCAKEDGVKEIRDRTTHATGISAYSPMTSFIKSTRAASALSVMRPMTGVVPGLTYATTSLLFEKKRQCWTEGRVGERMGTDMCHLPGEKRRQ